MQLIAAMKLYQCYYKADAKTGSREDRRPGGSGATTGDKTGAA
jgi:hypothetical protein